MGAHSIHAGAELSSTIRRVLSRSERVLFGSGAVLALLLRAAAWFRYRFDSDEQQHLHVAWGWTAGKVQYRDLFDNHAPLFHMVTAPVLALFGERSDILLWMRAPMLLLFAVVLWGTYVVARKLYDGRVALWAVLLLALFPPFFLKSLEYRTDNLWNAFWMLAVVGLVRGWRPFAVGLILGGALAVSLKTPLLLITLALSALLMPRRVPLRAVVEGAVGFVLVPGALALYFVAIGAWDDLVYCAFTFNSNLAPTREHAWIQRALFPFTFGAVAYAAWRTRTSEHAWRRFFALVMGVFTVMLAGFWLLISPRDFLPMMPLAAIFVAATLTQMRRPIAALATTIVLFATGVGYYSKWLKNETRWHVTMMNQALRLTRPGEPLMDLKGETIYRHRPFFYAFELITRTQMAHGIIEDTVAEDVVRERAYVAQADGPMWPPAARAWLSDHFVNMGRLRAAGQWVKADGTFTIGVPGEYVVLNANGVARGVLDGTPHTAPRVLAAGAHRFEGEQGVCVVWAPAYRRGHSPFHLRDLEF